MKIIHYLAENDDNSQDHAYNLRVIVGALANRGIHGTGRITDMPSGLELSEEGGVYTEIDVPWYKYRVANRVVNYLVAAAYPRKPGDEVHF